MKFSHSYLNHLSDLSIASKSSSIKLQHQLLKLDQHYHDSNINRHQILIFNSLLSRLLSMRSSQTKSRQQKKVEFLETRNGESANHSMLVVHVEVNTLLRVCNPTLRRVSILLTDRIMLTDSNRHASILSSSFYTSTLTNFLFPI